MKIAQHIFSYFSLSDARPVCIDSRTRGEANTHHQRQGRLVGLYSKNLFVVQMLCIVECGRLMTRIAGSEK
jgi:hypothetical protein